MADVADLEQEVGAEGDLLLAAELDGFRERLFGRAELAGLVELPVIGEVGFNGDPDDPAYRELLIRQRVNDAARGVMLATASGTDLDNLAANFNVERLLITPAVFVVSVIV